MHVLLNTSSNSLWVSFLWGLFCSSCSRGDCRFLLGGVGCCRRRGRGHSWEPLGKLLQFCHQESLICFRGTRLGPGQMLWSHMTICKFFIKSDNRLHVIVIAIYRNNTLKEASTWLVSCLVCHAQPDHSVCSLVWAPQSILHPVPEPRHRCLYSCVHNNNVIIILTKQ